MICGQGCPLLVAVVILAIEASRIIRVGWLYCTKSYLRSALLALMELSQSLYLTIFFILFAFSSEEPNINKQTIGIWLVMLNCVTEYGLMIGYFIGEGIRLGMRVKEIRALKLKGEYVEPPHAFLRYRNKNGYMKEQYNSVAAGAGIASMRTRLPLTCSPMTSDRIPLGGGSTKQLAVRNNQQAVRSTDRRHTESNFTFIGKRHNTTIQKQIQPEPAQGEVAKPNHLRNITAQGALSTVANLNRSLKHIPKINNFKLGRATLENIEVQEDAEVKSGRKPLSERCVRRVKPNKNSQGANLDQFELSAPTRGTRRGSTWKFPRVKTLNK